MPSIEELIGTTHEHKCESCGTIWEHGNNEARDSQHFDELHTCPNCGKCETYKHFKPGSWQEECANLCDKMPWIPADIIMMKILQERGLI